MVNGAWQDMGERIRTLRHNKNLTQAQFGERIGISRQNVGEIENGKAPSVEQIARICKETGTTMDYIVFGFVQPLSNEDFLNDFTVEQIDISLDILKGVAKLIKAKNGNELMIKALLRQYQSLNV